MLSENSFSVLASRGGFLHVSLTWTWKGLEWMSRTECKSSDYLCHAAWVLYVISMVIPDLTQEELTVQASLLPFDCLRIFFKFSFREMTEWVRRSWGPLIIIVELHSLTKKKSPNNLDSSSFIPLSPYLHTYTHTVTYPHKCL